MSEPDAIITITTASAQDILIIASAALSFVKSLMTVGTYSYFNVIFAFVELSCTGLAFAVFFTVDYLDEDERQEDGYGDDIDLYMLTFISGIIIEWLDLIMTYQTVRSYKRSKEKFPKTMTDNTKKVASCAYKFTFVYALLFIAIVPLIAFSKANWVTNDFAPTEFSPKNFTLLMSAATITVACQGIFAMFATLNATNPTGFVNITKRLSILLYVPNLIGPIMIYIALANVSGPEAGGLAYLTLINAMQTVESFCETVRHGVWYHLENPTENPCGGDATK